MCDELPEKVKTLKYLFIIIFTFLIGMSTFFGGSIVAKEISKGKVVTAEGVGVIVAKETAVARDRALEDALRKAVEQAVGTMISSDTVVQNYQLLYDRIYSKSRGYIQNYQIVSEGKKGENLYSVKIRASVSSGDIKDDLSALGLLMERKHNPRVMIFFAEQNVGEPGPSFWWDGKRAVTNLSIAETAINSRFLAKQFPIVDSQAAAKNIRLTNAYRKPDLSNDAARSLGNQFDAELVIVGKALAKYIGQIEGTTMKSFSATVTARAIRTDNGAVIAAANASVPAAHIDSVAGGSKALELASIKIADQLIKKIVDVWTREVSSTTTVQVVVSGLTSYGDFVKFKHILRDRIRGIQAIHQRKVGGGKALIDVDIKGDAQSMAEALATKSFEALSVNVKDVSQNRIEVEVSPK